MSAEQQNKLRLIASMVIFGTIGLVRRWIPCSSGVIALMRAAIGFLFLYALALLRRERFNWPAVKKNAGWLCLSGALLGFNWIALFEAYRYTTVSVATICYYMAPVMVILASPMVFHERLGLKQGVCAAVAVIGMVLVSGVIETGVSGLTGVLLGLAAAVMYAAIMMSNKQICGLSANERTIVQLGIAAVCMVPYVLLAEDPSPLLHPTGLVVVSLLVAGVLHTGVAYMLYFGSIHALKAQTAALYSYIDPVLSVLLSVLVLHEGVTAPAAIGIVLVLGATIVSEWQPRKKAA